MSLPIFSIKDAFLSALTDRHVVVSAATGSGKSTCLPLWASQFGTVLVIQPRRIACTSLADYLALQSGKPLGETIGYAIRFEQAFSEQSKVVFVTPGVALRWYFENKLSQFPVIMLDEFHERRWDMDLLLSILLKHQHHKLIVTSATLQGERFAEKLGATLLHSEGSLFPVEELFLSSDVRAMPSKDELANRVYSACEQALAKTTGDILVFLPGKAEIQLLQGTLKTLDAEIIPLFSGCDKRHQERALKSQEHRRIILATNVAETSLTIPNVSCVIDSGLERRTHLRQGRTVLNLEAIAKDSAKQRMGRAGRTQAGLCIRLYGQYAPLLERTPPEIQRESLTELVLAAACLDDGIAHLDFFEPLPESSVSRALATLDQVGAIDHQGKATELGRTLYPLPVDIELAQLIHAMPSSQLKQAMIDLVALIATPSKIYALPNHLEEQEQLAKAYPLCSDLDIAIAVVRGQLEHLVVDQEGHKEAKQYSEMLRAEFALPDLAHASSYDKTALIYAIANIQPNRLYVKRDNRRGNFANGVEEVSLASQTWVSEDNKAILVLDTFVLAARGTKNASTLATLAAPFPFKQLNDYVDTQDLIKRVEVTESALIVEVESHYAGVLLNQTSRECKPDELIPSLVMAIKQELLFAGIYTEISDALTYHLLYNQLHKLNSAIPDTETFIATTLIELGVESVEDLALISESDLAYHGLEAWELDALKEKYPLKLILAGQVLAVHYHLNARKVTVEYQSGLRKEAPKRWELPAWQGLNIEYQRASKVVPVR